MRRVYYIINDKERVYCERGVHTRGAIENYANDLGTGGV